MHAFFIVYLFLLVYFAYFTPIIIGNKNRNINLCTIKAGQGKFKVLILENYYILAVM